MKPRTLALGIVLAIALAACGGGKTATKPSDTVAPGPSSSASPLDSNSSTSTTATTIPTTTTTNADQDKQALVAAAKSYFAIVATVSGDANASADDPRLADVLADPEKSRVQRNVQDLRSKGQRSVHNDDVISVAVASYAPPTATAVTCVAAQASRVDANGNVITPSSLPDRSQLAQELQKGADGKWRVTSVAYRSAC